MGVEGKKEKLKRLKKAVVSGTLATSLLLTGCGSSKKEESPMKHEDRVSSCICIMDDDSYVVIDNYSSVLKCYGNNIAKIYIEDSPTIVTGFDNILYFYGTDADLQMEEYLKVMSEKNGKEIIYYSEICEQVKTKKLEK